MPVDVWPGQQIFGQVTQASRSFDLSKCILNPDHSQLIKFVFATITVYADIRRYSPILGITDMESFETEPAVQVNGVITLVDD